MGEGHRLSDLPEDVWIRIACLLDVNDRASLAQTAKQFRYAMDYGALTLGLLASDPFEHMRGSVRCGAYTFTPLR